eukprot:TRINITY_DN4645_c0_g2_i1.p1 TRINITY_DN4645_c0_g2~~TRINITY_DN4645_c0_g2_i1.p1  ORF type:complete len:303 (+),score=50.59 TRINITY_DN4645_c0_g2_i1:296-1204(+)
MLSGIGPRAHLNEFKISTLVDLPGVGQNLQDHFNVYHIFEANEPVSFDKHNVSMVKALAQWATSGKGPVGTSGLEASGFYRAIPPATEFDKKHLQPDVQIHFSPAGPFEELVQKYGLPMPSDPGYPKALIDSGFAKRFTDKTASCFIAVHTLLHYKSRGFVRLQSADPFSPPLIDPRFMQDEQDLDAYVESVSKVRRIVKNMKYLKGEVQPGDQVVDAKDLREYAKQYSWTCYHPVGTCKMGRQDDPDAVVDTQLRVRGVSGLRVIDASVMPEITSGNTNAPTIMIAEKASDIIKSTFMSKL